MLSEPTWRTSLVRHLESDPPRFVNPQRVMPSEIWYNTITPIVCTTKRSPMWGITPIQRPRWAAAVPPAVGAPASGFDGAGFFAAGLAGEGLAAEGVAGEGLVGEGLCGGVGAVWARAGCATASANKRATVRITTNSSSQLQRRVCP